MARITSKLQVTIPKALAKRYGLRPGDEIDWEEAGDVIRVVPPSARKRPVNIGERLRLFDEMVELQRRREAGVTRSHAAADRGWAREDLYDDRGRSR